MSNQPNIIYVVTHDTGRFSGPYHPEISFTPNLDRFADQSVRFNQAYCSSPCCGPSRVCAMTGKYAHRTGVLGLANMGWKLPWEQRTIVDDLNDAGYDTVHCGFQHERQYGQGRYQFDGTPGGDETWFKCDSRLAVDKAIGWLTERDKSRPFYLNLATNETHGTMFDGNLAQTRHGGPVALDKVWIPPCCPDTPYTRKLWANWYASLQYFDTHFGRLLSALDELDLTSNTIVVYTTDHGIGMHRGKGHVYDLGVEIGLLMRLPGGKSAGTTCDHLIPNIDYRPTMLEAAGLAIPGDIDGRSFWPVLAGRPYQPNQQLFIERNFHGEWASRGVPGFVDRYDPQRAVRTSDWHYIRQFRPEVRPHVAWMREIEDFEQSAAGPGLHLELPPSTAPREVEELYDVRADPWEQHNRADDPACAAIKADLAAALGQWMRQTDDPALRPGIPQPAEDPPIWPHAPHTVPVKRI